MEWLQSPVLLSKNIIMDWKKTYKMFSHSLRVVTGKRLAKPTNEIC